MITLYSYPTLFGVADNNGYGLKVFAFLRLAGLAFTHEHIFDASAAPRGQLPYLVDDGETIGDSETIVAHLIAKYRLTIDARLSERARDQNLLITRMIDDLYWVMSYSRWKDERYWPAFRDALMREHPSLTEEGLSKAREFNFQRYHYQGIRARACRSQCARRSHSAERLPARRDADQHRRRHLRLHCQHLFLRHRYAAEGIRDIEAKSRTPLHGNPRKGHGMNAQISRAR
jgi:hypothetical protein